LINIYTELIKHDKSPNMLAAQEPMMIVLASRMYGWAAVELYFYKLYLKLYFYSTIKKKNWSWPKVLYWSSKNK